MMKYNYVKRLEKELWIIYEVTANKKRKGKH